MQREKEVQSLKVGDGLPLFWDHIWPLFIIILLLYLLYYCYITILLYYYYNIYYL